MTTPTVVQERPAPATVVVKAPSLVGPQGIPGDVGAQGAQGPKGDKGDAGAKGDVGAAGPAGPAGPQGVKGDKGDKGDAGAKGDVGAQGPAGAAGAAGVAGPQGPQGVKGDTGAAGAAGAAGPQGVKGDKGDTGDVGPAGAAGAAGAAGPQGPAGPQGALGPQGPAGAAGPGVPVGGATGQVLRKASGANFDTSWLTLGSAAAAATGDFDAAGTAAAAQAAEAADRAAADAVLIPVAAIGAANGVAPLDAGALVPDANIPAGIARDAEVTAAVAAETARAEAAESVTATTLFNYQTDETQDRINGDAAKLAKAANLSDLANAGTARANLGLGTAAVAATTAFDAAGAAVAAQAAAIAASDQFLAPTAVKTAAYNANAGELVPVSTAGGAVAITLPTAPADKTRIGIILVTQTGANAVTVNCGGTDTLNKTGGATTSTIPILGELKVYQYKASNGVWYVYGLPMSQLDLRYDAIGAATAAAAASVPLSTVTAADDLIVASGNAAVTRLGVAASRIIGKKAAGGLTALTGAEALAIAGAEATANKGAAAGYMGLDAASRGSSPPKAHDHSAAGDPGGLLGAGAVALSNMADAAIDAMLPWFVNLEPFLPASGNTNFNTVTVSASLVKNAWLASSGAQNALVYWEVVLAKGTDWVLEFIHHKSTNVGIYTPSIGPAGGAGQVDKTTVDGYAASGGLNSQASVDLGATASTGKYRIQLKMATKNASSSSYFGLVSAVQLRRVS